MKIINQKTLEIHKSLNFLAYSFFGLHFQGSFIFGLFVFLICSFYYFGGVGDNPMLRAASRHRPCTRYGHFKAYEVVRWRRGGAGEIWKLAAGRSLNIFLVYYFFGLQFIRFIYFLVYLFFDLFFLLFR